MEIPEGWPTEDMIAAARDIPQIGHSSYYWRQVILNVLAAAPTPPEQDEPVAWMRHRLVSGAGGLGGGVAVEFSEHPFGGFDDPAAQDKDATIEPLYTRPDNSTLRKAAEELISTFDRIKCLESRYGPCPAIENLRAALEAT